MLIELPHHRVHVHPHRSCGVVSFEASFSLSVPLHFPHPSYIIGLIFISVFLTLRFHEEGK